MEPASSTSFGSLLRSLRLARGLTQEELAERAGMSANGISALERGVRRAPLASTVQLLIGALSLEGEERERLLAVSVDARETPELHAPPLPAELSTFVGREAEIAAVAALLSQGGVRLLTLRGEGGIGKTRLALRVLARVSPDYDAVYFASLGDLADASLLPATVMRALAMGDSGAADRLESLKKRLGRHRVLLGLDNMEHLLAAAGFVAELLGALPEMTVLATSRRPLQITGEVEYAVPPLAHSLPAPAGRSPARASDAVQLFLQRARAVTPGVGARPAELRAIEEICDLLDGLPLGIELAAARIRHLSPAEMLGHLRAAEPGKGLRLLRDGPRDAPTRQQTLFNAFDWSYQLLSTREKQLFAQLSVFAGGCSLQAVEAVCGGDGDVLTEVAAIVAASMIRHEIDSEGRPRYTMLETMRAFARERLAERGDRADVMRRHAEYFLALATELEPQLSGATQAQVADLYEVEHYNFRAALQWSIDAGQALLGCGLGAKLWRFWWLHGHLREGLTWLQRLAAGSKDVPPVTRLMVLFGAGTLASMQSEFGLARPYLEEALALSRELGDERRELPILNALGIGLHEEGRYQEAAKVYRLLAEKAQELDDQGIAATSLINLGMVALAERDYPAAYSAAIQALPLFRKLGDTQGMVVALVNAGDTAVLTGDLVTGARHFDEALRRSLELNNRRFIAVSLEGIGSVLARVEHAVDAARLYGAGHALRQSIGVPIAPSERLTYDGHKALIREQLDTGEYERAWQEGAMLDLAVLQAEYAQADGDGAVSPILGVLRAVEDVATRYLAVREF